MSIFWTRLRLQQGLLHSLNRGLLMMSPRPKSLKRVFQQVANTVALTSPLLLISKTPFVLIHFCFFFAPYVLYLPPPSLQMPSMLFCILIFCQFLPPLPLLVLLHKLSTHLHLFHACFSKTVFILYCGLWRMWSQAIRKVSDRCAMSTLRSAAYTGLPLFFLPLTFLILIGSVSVCDTYMFTSPLRLSSPVGALYYYFCFVF